MALAGEVLTVADTPAAPGLLAAVKAVLPKLLSRKLLVTIVTKGSILAVAWLSTKIDAHLATTMIEVVVPSLVVTGVGYGVEIGRAHV